LMIVDFAIWTLKMSIHAKQAQINHQKSTFINRQSSQVCSAPE